jgi:hypothetical protein
MIGKEAVKSTFSSVTLFYNNEPASGSTFKNSILKPQSEVELGPS